MTERSTNMHHDDRCAEEERPTAWKEPLRTSPSQQPLSGQSGHCDPTSSTARSGATATSSSSSSFFGRIRVVVRCRPLQPDTEGDHTDNRVHAHGDEVLVCEKNNPAAGRSYRFDRVLPPDADQASMFAEVAPLVDHVLDGFHATVFAYGQTGSGKTFTMDGLRYVASNRGKGMTTAAMVPDAEGTPAEQHGVMPRIIQLLFDHARARQGDEGREEVDDGVEYTFRCSYYQIYNEKITDLLRNTGASPDPDGGESTAAEGGEAARRSGGATGMKRRFDENGLRVRWHKGDVFKLENLFVCTCTSPDEMRAMLYSGIQQKVMSSHMMNQQSSRSHCIFTVYVECRSRRNGELHSKSELSLVDLAGSEKIGLLSSNPSAKLVKESIDINTSLLALGKVIMALSSRSNAATKPKRRVMGGGATASGGGRRPRGPVYGGSGGAHIPYRDSKLTMLLKHALGGNSLTTMIACISPSDRYVEETTSTLLYAGRAKNIRNAPHVNEDATTTLIRQLREEVAQLKVELGCYQEMANRSLADPDPSHARVCARCGGDTLAVATTDASHPPPAGGSPVKEAAAVAHEADQLADSLIAACDIVKNMMQLNAELRGAFDAVRVAQDGSERREADLNAENLALRERLSVLESIVLQDENNDDDEDVEKDEREGALSDSAMREAQETAATAAKAAAALRATGGVQQKPDREGTAAASSSASSTPPSTVPLDTPTRPQVEALRAISVGPSTLKEKMPHVTKPLPQPVTAATAKVNKTKLQRVSRSASPTPTVRGSGPVAPHGQRSKKSQRNKKHRALARRLKEYEQHYRAPSKIQSYEDFYDKPKKSRAPTVPGVLLARASGPEAAQTTAALEDMKVTVAKLPKNVVPEYVPASLLGAGLFGSLAFGGQQEERGQFEQARSDRAARLRALQQKQQDLYQQVHHAVRNVSSYPTVAPLPQLEEGEELPSTSHAGEEADVLTSAQPQRRGSGGSLGARRPCADRYAAYGHAPTRQQAAKHQEGKSGTKSFVRRSTDSMTRLMEYLERGAS